MVKKRLEYLSHHMAYHYFLQCEEEGLFEEDCEDFELFKKGEEIYHSHKKLANELSDKKKEIELKIKEVEKTDSFLKEAQPYLTNDWSLHANIKRRILKNNFSRFMKGGSQYIERYDDTRTGFIFKQVLDSERLKKEKLKKEINDLLVEIQKLEKEKKKYEEFVKLH
jgi:hypothetical protein